MVTPSVHSVSRRSGEGTNVSPVDLTALAVIPVESVALRRRGGDFDFRMPLSQRRMARGDPHNTSPFLSAYPDGSHAPNENKRIVADQFGGAGDLQPDGIVGERSDIPKLIRHPQHDAGAVGAIRGEAGVIRQHREILIEAAP